MSIWVQTQRSQKEAADDWNEYCMAKAELIDEFDQETDRIADLYDGPEFDEAMKELESRPRFFRHVMEMKRLIEQCKDADRRAAATPGASFLVDTPGTIAIDHRHPLNPRYEPTKRVVFDMGRGTGVRASSGPITVGSGSRRGSTVKFTNNPLGKSEG